MSRADLLIRPLTGDDDPDALFDLRCRAFGPATAAGREQWLADVVPVVADGRFLAAFDGGRLIAAARFYDMTQWWAGRSLPMAGVAGVMVAPEDRGRGAGRAIMAAVLSLIADRGYPLSALHPATMPLYRSLGWEVAGFLDTVRVPTRSLRWPHAGSAAGSQGGGAQGPPAGLRRAGPKDASALLGVLARAHEASRDCGPNLRDEPTVRRWLSDEDAYVYLAQDGALAYRWRHGTQQILVDLAVSQSERTCRGLWEIVGSHASMAATVRARAAPTDPVWWLTAEPDVELARRTPWMLRIVDAPAAVAGRGFPAAARAAETLLLEDAERPGNAGLWRLEVSGGRGTLLPAAWGAAGLPGQGPGTGAPLALGARGFAALFAGVPVAALRRSGLADGGDPRADAGLDAVFGARAYLLDYF